MTSIDDIFLFPGSLGELNSRGKGQYGIINPNIIITGVYKGHYGDPLLEANQELREKIKQCNGDGAIYYSAILSSRTSIITRTKGDVRGDTDISFRVCGVPVSKRG